MPAIRTASVWSPIDRAYDGLRILATRYVPRTCRRTRYDVWMPNLGPSEQLLKSFRAGRVKWEEFAERYEEELFQPPPLDRNNPRIKNHGQKFTLRLIKKLAAQRPLTLMCDCADDEPHCHLRRLEKILRSNQL